MDERGCFGAEVILWVVVVYFENVTRGEDSETRKTLSGGYNPQHAYGTHGADHVEFPQVSFRTANLALISSLSQTTTFFFSLFALVRNENVRA